MSTCLSAGFPEADPQVRIWVQVVQDHSREVIPKAWEGSGGLRDKEGRNVSHSLTVSW